MTRTIQEILDARKQKIAASKLKISPLKGHIKEIVDLLNGGAYWVDIVDYLKEQEIFTLAGAPFTRSPIMDWCALNVPVYDEEVGTPDSVKAGRVVALNGSNKYTRNAVAKRRAKDSGEGDEALPVATPKGNGPIPGNGAISIASAGAPTPVSNQPPVVVAPDPFLDMSPEEEAKLPKSKQAYLHIQRAKAAQRKQEEEAGLWK